MWAENLNKFIESVFKPCSVDMFFWIPTNGTDGNYAVFRDALKTVTIAFRSSPTGIIDDGNTISSEPIPVCPHTKSIVNLQWFREILIRRKVRCNRSRKMTKDFQRLLTVMPYSMRTVKLIIVYVPADESIFKEIIVFRCDASTV